MASKAMTLSCFRNPCVVFIKPHHSTTWVQPTAIDGVAWSVSQSVCHDGQPCKNNWSDQDAISNMDLVGPKEL